MNLPAFIAYRLSGKDKDNFSGPVIGLARIAVALGLSVMLFSVAVLVGFQQEIREKVIGFSAHIQVGNFDTNASFEALPVETDPSILDEIAAVDGVKHVQVFAFKAGIIKTDDQIQGVILKGVGQDFDWAFVKTHLTDGQPFSLPDSTAGDGLIISSAIARKLSLKTGDEARMYFITGTEAQPRGRKFIVSGIYETGLEEFDEMYVMADLRHIQRLNNWTPGQVSGFEVFIHKFKDIDRISGQVYHMTGYDLNTETVVEKFPQIFDWLRLMDLNVVVILVMMILVAGITVISTLLILILERTSMIGILKALGMPNSDIRKLFLYLSLKIILFGMLWGNLAGLGISFLQYYTRILPLDQESYYVSYVPVAINYLHILVINAGTLFACCLMILIPGYVIGRISPVRAIRFE